MDSEMEAGRMGNSSHSWVEPR